MKISTAVPFQILPAELRHNFQLYCSGSQTFSFNNTAVFFLFFLKMPNIIFSVMQKTFIKCVIRQRVGRFLHSPKKKVQSLNSGSRDFRHTRTSRLQL
jgi:hypothetical protein